jgi:hypothetical protein
VEEFELPVRALMQRANQAYARNDLLTFLELQLEMEHIHQGAINDISEGRLKHYNKVLKEQLAEPDGEILHLASESWKQICSCSKTSSNSKAD